jgi:hypothetical protein
MPCAAAAADVGPASEGRGEAAALQRRDPRFNPGRLRRVTVAAHSLATARAPSLLPYSAGRQAGAPKVRP